MKTKFSLVLLTVNSLLLVTNNSAFADRVSSTVSSNNISLSQTICKLVDLDREVYCLVEMAIDRASIAKGIQTSQNPTIDLPSVPATNPVDKDRQTKPNSQPVNPPQVDKPAPQPIINDKGQVIVPRRNYIIGARG